MVILPQWWAWLLFRLFFVKFWRSTKIEGLMLVIVIVGPKVSDKSADIYLIHFHVPVISDHLLTWYPNFGTPQFSDIPNDHQLRSGNEVLLPSWFFWCRSASRFVSMWCHSLPTVRQGPHIRPEKLVSACSTRALPVKVSFCDHFNLWFFLFIYVGEWHLLWECLLSWLFCLNCYYYVIWVICVFIVIDCVLLTIDHSLHHSGAF